MENGSGDRPENSQSGEDDRDRVQAKSEEQDILVDDADGMASKSDRLGQHGQRVAHQNDRASLGRQVAADPREGQTDVGPSQGGCVVDAVTYHRHDPAVLPSLVDPLGLARGAELGFDLFDVDPPGHCLCRRDAVSRQDRQVFQAQVLQIVNHVVCLRPHTIAGSDDAGDLSIADNDQDRLPGTVEILDGPFDLGRNADPVLADQPEVADQNRRQVGGFRQPELCQDPRTRLGLKFLDLRQRQATPPGLSDKHLCQGMLAGLLGRGSQPQDEIRGCRFAGLLARGSEGVAIAEFGIPFGEGSGLVEGQGVNPGESFDGCAPLDEYAAPGQPRRCGEDGRGSGKHQRTGAGDHEHRDSRHEVEPRRDPVRDPSPEGEPIGRQEDQHCSTQHRGQEPPGVAVGRALQR
jgi:hypothetical protein